MSAYRPNDRVCLTIDGIERRGTVTSVDRGSVTDDGPLISVSVSGVGAMQVRAAELSHVRRGD